MMAPATTIYPIKFIAIPRLSAVKKYKIIIIQLFPNPRSTVKKKTNPIIIIPGRHKTRPNAMKNSSIHPIIFNILKKQFLAKREFDFEYCIWKQGDNGLL